MVTSSILLVLLSARASHAASVYNIVPRPAFVERSLASASPSESPLISFDGDLNAIQELALAKASRESVRTAFSCDDQVTKHLEILNWKYSIETVPNAVVPTVFGEVQEVTLQQVGPLSLSCLNNTAAFAKIVAMDTAIPGDQLSNGSYPNIE